MKTETITSSVISAHAIEIVKASMANIPFYGAATDASNHLALKMFPSLFNILIGNRVDCRQSYWMFRVNIMK
jgi:hypothetical protein